MAINDKQKIVVLDINSATEQTIKDRLLAGYVIQQIVNLAPVQSKLLIVYSEPEII